MHRLVVFLLSLTCGHLVTLAVDGWYPVSVACCNRLGGTLLRGNYVPYSSNVDYVDVVSEHYETRPSGSPRDPTRLLTRRSRTDQPSLPMFPGDRFRAGPFSLRVGAVANRDGSPLGWTTAGRRSL